MEGVVNTPLGDLGDETKVEPAAPVTDLSTVVPEEVAPEVPPVEEHKEEEEEEDENNEENEEEENEEEELPASNFYEDVAAITGKTYEVDFGDVDPLSPDGVAMRDKAVEAQAVVEFEGYLESKYPKAYAYLNHLSSGGTDEEWKMPTNSIPNRESIEEDADVQKAFTKSRLVRSGLEDDVADLVIQNYIKQNKLSEKALSLYALEEQQEKQALLDINKAAKERELAYNQSINNYDAVLSTTVDDLAYRVPDTKKAAFLKYVQERTVFNGSEFYIQQKVDSTSLKSVTEALLFQFNGGKFDQLIAKGVNTKAAQRLRNTAAKDTKVVAGNVQTSKTSSKNVPLGELFNDK